MVKCLLDVSQLKYNCLPCVASVLAGLAKYHSLVVPMVDGVLEEIRLGLERNDPSETQRRVAFIALLGEFYNYNLVSSQV